MQPAQDRLPGNLLSLRDAWLVGSRSEGFGLPILEAMACRTPVIATPTGAAPELIAGGGGVLTPIDDPRSMAREIERIVQLPEPQWDVRFSVRDGFGYSWDDAVKLFEAALQKC